MEYLRRARKGQRSNKKLSRLSIITVEIAKDLDRKARRGDTRGFQWQVRGVWNSRRLPFDWGWKFVLNRRWQHKVLRNTSTPSNVCQLHKAILGKKRKEEKEKEKEKNVWVRSLSLKLQYPRVLLRFPRYEHAQRTTQMST